MAETRLAFALAGLGGFNAHGAGFLQAARDNDIRPDLVEAHEARVARHVSRDYGGQPSSDPTWMHFGHGTRSCSRGDYVHETVRHATTVGVLLHGGAIH